MKAGFAVFEELQETSGSCVLYPKEEYLTLNAMPTEECKRFLMDMRMLGEAILYTCQPLRVDYTILGKKENSFQANVYPIYEKETEQSTDEIKEKIAKYLLEKAVLEDFVPTEFTGNIKEDIKMTFEHNNLSQTFSHSCQVGQTAKRIAKKYGLDQQKAEIAGFLHDIGGIVPNEQRVEIAEKLGIGLFSEERAFPMIIHQKLSKYIACEVFQVTDKEILSAVECHTTLKSDSTTFDQVLFIADKISWDQPSNPPYLFELLEELDDSIESAARFFVDYLINSDLRVVHPWLKEAAGSFHLDFKS
jgi:predicted HD superfamily hydrolase involved in NAD metabolism